MQPIAGEFALTELCLNVDLTSDRPGQENLKQAQPSTCQKVQGRKRI